MTLVKGNVLPKLNDDLKGLIQLSNSSFNNLNEALEQYIKFGINKIGFETGIISKVEGDDYTILEVINPDEKLHKGMIVPLYNTLCKKAIETKSTLISADVKKTNLYNLPARKMLDIAAVICTPLIVNNKIYGTLTFCSKEVKQHTQLWEYDVSIVEILGQSVSKILKEHLDENVIKTKSAYLEQFNDDLKAFSKIGATEFNSFSENLTAYINFGKKITGFQNCIISEINEQVYKIIQASTINNLVEPGATFNLCDTLCREVIERKKTVVYPKLKNSKYYEAMGRIALGTEATIMVPLRNEDSIFGVLSFCSTKEQVSGIRFNYHVSIVELIAEKISKLCKENKISTELKKEKQLLKMGAEVFEMASYKRPLNDDKLHTTEAFRYIFDIESIVEKDYISASEMINILEHKILEEDKACFFKNIEQSKTESIEPFEYRIRTKEGKIRWLRHQIQLDEDNQCLLGVVQNITSTKKVQEKLQLKNRELEQFAYATAHDLQEPLRTIQGYSKVLRETYLNQFDETGKEYFSYLMNASKRMKEQIDGLLDHSRIGRKKEKTVVNMNRLVADVLSDLKGSINNSKAKIITKDLPKVNGYKTELHLLLLNLIGNALKFVQTDCIPVIEIGTEKVNLYYQRFYIKDNGIGISKENINKIFKLFARLNCREDYEGTGIGLTHCKKIVQLHKGEINVQSVLGKGSTFLFTIKNEI